MTASSDAALRDSAALSWGYELQRLIEDLIMTLPEGRMGPLAPDPPGEIKSDI